MAAAAILDLFELEIAPLDLLSTKTYPRTKHEVDRITRSEIWPFAYVGAFMEPPFWGEGEVVGGQQWHH